MKALLRLALNHQTAMILDAINQFVELLRLALNHQTAMIRSSRMVPKAIVAVGPQSPDRYDLARECIMEMRGCGWPSITRPL